MEPQAAPQGQVGKSSKKNYRPRKWGPTPSYERKPEPDLRRIEDRIAAFGSVLRRPSADGTLRPLSPEELKDLFDPAAMSAMLEEETPEEARRTRSSDARNQPPRTQDLLFHRLRPIVRAEQLREAGTAALELLSLLSTFLESEVARGAPLEHELTFLTEVREAADRFREARQRLRRDARRLGALDSLSSIYAAVAALWPKKGRRSWVNSDNPFCPSRVRTPEQTEAIEWQRAALGLFVDRFIDSDARASAAENLVVDGDYVHALNGPRRAAATRLEEYLDVSATKLEKLRQQAGVHAERAATTFAHFVPAELAEHAAEAPIGLLINDAAERAARFTSWLVLAADPRLGEQPWPM